MTLISTYRTIIEPSTSPPAILYPSTILEIGIKLASLPAEIFSTKTIFEIPRKVLQGPTANKIIQEYTIKVDSSTLTKYTNYLERQPLNSPIH